MRLAFDPQRQLDCPAIDQVVLNLNCRDEIIPILRALQHVYQDEGARHELLDLIGNDVNGTTSHKLGRRGLDYWPIAVLAAVRLGCNLDYDKLQDLAEQHRNLRLMMGLGDWREPVFFDWRRIRDNLCLLQPTTLEKINQLIVKVGHQLVPEAAETVRGDTFVVETNVHYPTESTLIGDGLRKIINLATVLAREHGLAGWRQHQHLLQQVREAVREISRAARAKGKGTARLEAGYRELLRLAKDLLARAEQLLQQLTFQVEVSSNLVMRGLEHRLLHYMSLTEKVSETARRRVLEGETVPNEEKIFSIFEPETELIKRGKVPDEVQFGHNVLVIEDGAGFICYYEVLANGVLDQEAVIPAMRKLQKRLGGKIKRASFDRGFHTPENQRLLAKIVQHPCLPKKGEELGRQQQAAATVEFRQARQSHPGVESAIGALQAGNGQERCRDRSRRGYERYVGLGVLGRNLHVLGKLLLAREAGDCQATQTKRKARSA
jgi:hypothetical protein